jgi:tRNA(Ile)-lysidine synthase|tara:strand:+ start:103109 stop:104095 length:987 start_codon:yes stop_codon:yes gene_type:complete
MPVNYPTKSLPVSSKRGWKLTVPDYPALALPTHGPLALAVSGGGDSLGMLALALHDQRERLTVLTVDHALRTDSAADAAHVEAICAQQGVPCRVLRLDWGGAPPAANRQSAARRQRYRALTDACGHSAIPYLLTAHHLDDQAETVLMRLSRGSGVTGLSGIRAQRRLSADVTLLRPCLHLTSDTLHAAAAAAGFAVREDPSNRDPAYDRTRYRALLNEVQLDAARLAASAAHLADADAALDWAAELAFQSRSVEGSSEGRGQYLNLDLAGLPSELRRRMLLRAFAALRAPVPRGPALVDFMERLDSGGTAQLSGLRGRGGARWTLWSE